MGRSGQPSALAWARPSVVNAAEQITREESPSFTASTLSWTLHDVQEPQSPDPVITTSHFSDVLHDWRSPVWTRRAAVLLTQRRRDARPELADVVRKEVEIHFELSMKPTTLLRLESPPSAHDLLAQG